MNELGVIRIYRNADGYKLIIDAEFGGNINPYIGLEGIGETFYEALEDLYTSAELLNIGEQ